METIRQIIDNSTREYIQQIRNNNISKEVSNTADKWKKFDTETIGETWQPEIGDEIQGIYIQKKTDIGPNKSNKYVIEQEDHSIIEVWGNAMLNRFFDSLVPEEGRQVKIKYLGQEKGQKGQKYHSYDLYSI